MVVIFFYFCNSDNYYARNAEFETMVLAFTSFCGNYFCQGNEDHVIFHAKPQSVLSHKAYFSLLSAFALFFFLKIRFILVNKKYKTVILFP